MCLEVACFLIVVASSVVNTVQAASCDVRPGLTDFRNCEMINLTLAVTTATFDNVTWTAGELSFASSNHVDVTLSNCTLLGLVNVLSWTGGGSVTNLRVRIANSRIQSSGAVLSFVSGTLSSLTNVSLIVESSSITAVLAAMAVIYRASGTLTLSHVLMSSASSNVSVSASINGAVAVGLAKTAGGGSVSVVNFHAVIVASDIRMTSSAEFVASVGFVARGPLRTENCIITIDRSFVSASGMQYVASAGWSLSESTLTISNSSVISTRSTITSVGRGVAVTSMGWISFNGAVTVHNASATANHSTVTGDSGGGYVVVLGWLSRNSALTAAFTIAAAHNSVISASSRGDSVIAIGWFAYIGGVAARDSMGVAVDSAVTASSGHIYVAAMAWQARGGTLLTQRTTLVAQRSEVVGYCAGHSVAVVGWLGSDQSSIVASDSSASVITSSVAATGGPNTVVVGLMGGNVRAARTALVAEFSDIETVAVGYGATVALLAYGNAVVDVVNTTITLVLANISTRCAQGGALSAAIGALRLPPNAAPSVVIDQLSLYICSSYIASSENALTIVARSNSSVATGRRFATMHPVTVLDFGFVVFNTTVRTDTVSPHGDCLTVAPSGSIPSLILNATLQCRGATGGPPVVPPAAFTVSGVNASLFLGANTTLVSTFDCDSWEWGCGVGFQLRRSSSVSHSRSHSVSSDLSRSQTFGTWSPSLIASNSVSSSQSVTDGVPAHTSTSSITHREALFEFYSTASPDSLVTQQPVSSVLPLGTFAPSPPPARTTSGALQLTVLMPEATSDVVASTAASSTIATAVVNPTAAAQVARVGGTVRVLECALVADDEAPSFMEMPLQVPIGGGSFRRYAGALLLTTLLLVLLPFTVHAVVWHRALPGLKLCSAVHAVSVQYFVPSCAAAIALLLANSADTNERCIALGSVLSIITVVAVTTRRLAFEVPDSIAMFAFVDGTSDVLSKSKRLYALEEMFVSTFVAAITGMRRGSCKAIAVVLVGVIASHLGYLLVAKPYRTKLDTFFAVTGSTVQFALCITATVILYFGTSDYAEEALAILLLSIFLLFLLQSCVTLVWSLWVAQRKKMREDTVGIQPAGSPQAPLLAAPSTTTSSSTSAAASVFHERIDGTVLSSRHYSNPLAAAA